jgi:cyclase
MLATRVIPCLLLQGTRLVKTVSFRDPSYVGDPRNAVKIFNEKEVDELVLLDIGAASGTGALQFDLIREIVSEAFMPVTYGGGIRTVEDARAMLGIGVEKVVVNTAAVTRPQLVSEIAEHVGGQSVVAGLDARRTTGGGYEVWVEGGRRNTGLDPAACAAGMEARGAGEIFINSIDRDGTRAGYDLELLRRVSSAVSVPVIACGGAGSLADFASAVKEGGAAAVSAGSFFVHQGRHRAVLISYPDQAALRRLFA